MVINVRQMKNQLRLGISCFMVLLFIKCNKVQFNSPTAHCKIKKFQFECTSDSICKILINNYAVFEWWESNDIKLTDGIKGHYFLNIEARDSMIEINPHSYGHPMTALIDKEAAIYPELEPRDFRVLELIKNQKYMVTSNQYRDTSFVFLNGVNEVDVTFLEMGNAVELFKNHVINIRHVK